MARLIDNALRRRLPRQRAAAWLLLIPYLLGGALLVALPAMLASGMAFIAYDGLKPPRWAGTFNFLLVATDALFALSVQNTLALVLVGVPVRLAVALGAALLLRRGGPGLPWLRAGVLLPGVIPVPAYALAWLWILNPLYGPLNLTLAALGLPTFAWLADAQMARPALVLVLAWTIGEGFLTTLAALHAIPREVEEAARVDGAGAWGRLRHLTLPLIAPALLLLAMRDVVVVIQESFVATLLLTGGGPYYATYTLPLFIYEQGFDLQLFGTAAVGLLALYVLTALLLLALAQIARGWDIGVHDDPLFG